MMRRVWTQSELMTLRDNYGTMSHAELCELLCRSWNSIQSQAQKSGLTKHNHPVREGDIINSVTVLRKLDVAQYGGRRIECQCHCGKIFICSAMCLKNGNTKSCGCARHQSHANRIVARKPAGHTSWNCLYTSCKHSAQKFNREFNLTFEQFKQLCSKPCHYCGSLPKIWNKYLTSDGNYSKGVARCHISEETIKRAYIRYNGLDRTNNEVGYREDNVVACCIICNRAKNNMPFSDWISYLNQLVLFRKISL